MPYKTDKEKQEWQEHENLHEEDRRTLEELEAAHIEATEQSLNRFIY